MPGQLIEKWASAFVIILHPGCLLLREAEDCTGRLFYWQGLVESMQ